MGFLKARGKAVLSLLISFLFLIAIPFNGNATPYRKSKTEEKKIALTFDDGPSRRHTEEILSVLAEYNISATFFVIGENAVKDPERILSIAEAGHEIGNHTYTHAYISKITERQLRDELQKTEDALVKITGQRPRVFRPPGGYYNDASLAIVTEMGYKSVLWSLDTRDWSMPESDTVFSCVEENATAGDIILFHDLEDKRLPTPKALRKIIPYLLENGYEFVTVSQLIENEAE